MDFPPHIFRFRAIKPILGRWVECACRDTLAEAIQWAHQNSMLPSYTVALPSGEHVYLSLVEVAGEELPYISRMFHLGIWRSGGVKHHHPSLTEIAHELGWTGDPEELISEEGWEGEEPYAQ